MNSFYSILAYAFGLVVMTSTASADNFGLGFGLSYNQGGGGYYAPGFAQGGGCGVGCGGGYQQFNPALLCQPQQPFGPYMNQGGPWNNAYMPGFGGPGLGGPGFGPQMMGPPPLPASRPIGRNPVLLPPNLMLQNSLQPMVYPNMQASYPNYPWPNYVGPGNVCGGGCGAGLVQQPIYPVPGGPMLDSGMYARQGASDGIMSVDGGSTVIIDARSRNEWEKDDTASIVFAAGIGMGMQATNVYPFMGQRHTYVPDPTFYNMGDRIYGYEARPTH